MGYEDYIYGRKKMGDVASGNYTEVEDDGTMVAYGEATTWDDLVGSLVASRLNSTSGKLNYNYAENSITMQSGGSISNESDRLIFNFQQPHAIMLDSEMRLHIHWEQPNSNKIEFTTQYRIQSNNAAKTTAWTTVNRDSDVDSAFPYVSGTLNQITKLAEIDLTGTSISSTIQFRLSRVDTTGGDIEAIFVDAHVESDTNGSREEYIK